MPVLKSKFIFFFRTKIELKKEGNYELIFDVFLQQTLSLCTNRDHIF